MNNSDLFSSTTQLGVCFSEFYRQLMTGETVSYDSVFPAAYHAMMELEPQSYPPLQPSWSYSTHVHTRKLYQSLKKAVRIAREELEQKEPGCFRDNGKLKGVEFRYVGANPDPLREERDNATLMSVRRYVEFCQDTDGLVPRDWTNYFLRNTRDLLQIRESRRRQCIQADIHFELTNLNLLPQIYEAIIGRKALCFTYVDFRGNRFPDMVFHPQLLKEYNGRWQLFGETDAFRNLADKPFFNVALDRIEGGVRIAQEKYRPAPAGRYEAIFSRMVGVTQADLIAADGGAAPKIYCVRIRVLTRQMFGLLTTKKLHPEQRTVVEWGEHPDGTYGEVELRVMMNHELLGQLLHLGKEAVVVSPEEVVGFMRRETAAIARLYDIGSSD